MFKHKFDRPNLILFPGICSSSDMFLGPNNNGLAKYLKKYFNLHFVNFPLKKNRTEQWCFDFHLHKEIGEMWLSICNKTLCKPFVLGYSMGGLLALTAQALNIINSPAIFAVASPFRFEKTGLYPFLINLFAKTRLKILPTKLAGRILCMFYTIFLDKSNYDNILLFKRFIKSSAVSVPAATLQQVGQWFKYGYLSDRYGKNYLNILANIKNPCCFIAGKQDVMAPPAAVKVGYDIVTSCTKEFKIVNGNHISLADGENAKQVSKIVKNFAYKHFYELNIDKVCL